MFSFSAASREREPDTYVPYIGHDGPGTLLLDDGSRLVVIRLGGVAWETADTEVVNARHAQRNILLRNIASPRLVLATHVVRSMADHAEYPAGECRSAFARELDAAYRARLLDGRLYRNDLFLSVLLRPSQAGGKRVSGLLNRRRRGDTGRVSSVSDAERLAHLIHGMAGIRRRVSRKLLIAFTDRVSRPTSTHNRAAPHPPCPMIRPHPSSFQPWAARSSPPPSMAAA